MNCRKENITVFKREYPVLSGPYFLFEQNFWIDEKRYTYSMRYKIDVSLETAYDDFYKLADSSYRRLKEERNMGCLTQGEKKR